MKKITITANVHETKVNVSCFAIARLDVTRGDTRDDDSRDRNQHRPLCCLNKRHSKEMDC